MSYPTEDAAFYAWIDGLKAGELTGAVSGSVFASESKVTIDPASGSIAVTGAIIPVRGHLVVAAGKTVTAGYLYGTQGKITVKGTLNHSASEYSAGLVGQLDLSAAVALTSGTLSMLWLDAGAASAVALSSVSGIVITNTIALKPMHAILNVPLADATYFADLNDTADSPWIVAGAVGGSQDKKLKIKLNGTNYFIACNTA
jgi:hypothetical protein